MGRRTYTPEQIINKLREVEVFIRQGATAAEASRKVGLTKKSILKAQNYSSSAILTKKE